MHDIDTTIARDRVDSFIFGLLMLCWSEQKTFSSSLYTTYEIDSESARL